MAQKKRESNAEVARTHCGVPVPTNPHPGPEWDLFHEEVESRLAKRAFIDRTIIALFARGYPQDKLFERAELLWRLREENRKR